MSVLNTVLLNKIYIPENSNTFNENNQVTAINNLNIKVDSGEFCGIMGKSGCGKTTLLKLLGSIEKPSSGFVYYNKININELPLNELLTFRRKNIGFIFQDFKLLGNLSVKENIILPLVLDDKVINKQEEEKAEALTQKIGIQNLLDRYPFELSGGEKQRVAICRALINNPALIFADEPTGNLDSKSAQTVIDTLTKINQELGKTIVMVTHDPMAASFCSRIIFLKDGSVLDEIKNENSNDILYSKIINRMREL